MSPVPCKVCANLAHNELFTVKEMQLGLREPFTYQLCGDCGAMQLLDIPADLSKYYPNENYYSFTAKLDSRSQPDTLRKIRSSFLLHGRNKVLGGLLSLGYKQPEYLRWVKVPGVSFTDKILDVGTGNGFLLLELFKNGFTNLTGIDPFIDADTQHGPIHIYKKDVFGVQDQYDYIMLHHVFEHMDEPQRVLQQLWTLLKPGKFLLIRTPVMGVYGWQTYGTNWVGLDAPRHIIIHTVESIRRLARQTGFELRTVEYDSGAYHLWASEQYKRDIALMEERSYMINREKSPFSKEDIEAFKKTAERTNEESMGDQAAFYLYKPL